MENKPAVKIQYLVNYDLEIVLDNNKTSPKNDFCDRSNINNQDNTFNGKKPLFLNGGSVDNNTGEVSGTLLDGSYTFFKNQSEYQGFIGTSFSREDYYVFNIPQYVTIRATNDNTYINNIIIYFDKIAGEYATGIRLSNALKNDGSNFIELNSLLTQVIPNDKYIFTYDLPIHNQCKEIRITFYSWSKKNSLVKFLKIVTGLTEIYDNKNLLDLDFTRDKINDSSQLRFGVSNNSCHIELVDKDSIIKNLYNQNLIYKNIRIEISIGGIQQGIYYLDEKTSDNSLVWKFDCVDKLRILRDIKKPMFPIKSRTIYELVNTILSDCGTDIIWEIDAKSYCQSMTITDSYFNGNQTLYDLLLKCCQVGLLRIYIDRLDRINITSGVN